MSSPPARVRDRLHLLREVDLEPAREVEVVLRLHQVRDATLPRLRVDADDRLVVAADVLRVERQVRHVPHVGPGSLLGVHPLLDRVLVRARERGVDELADVRVARVHGELVALLDDAARLVELCEVERRVDALRQQVEGEGDQVDVPRPLPVAEQAALDALGAGHQAELGCRDGRPAVVVRVDGHDRAVPAREVPAEPLHAVGVDVRREGLDGRRQVDDHLRAGSGIPLLRNGLADLERVVELRVVEALRRVLEHDVAWRCRQRAPCRAPYRERRAP